MMKANWLAAALCLTTAALSAQTTNPREFRTVTQVFDGSVSGAERAITAAAAALPEDRDSFVPSSGEFKGVRSFLQMVKHIAVDNYMNGAALLGEKVPIEIGEHENGPDSVRTKTAVVGFLKDSFAYLHKAIRTIDEKNLMSPAKDPWGGEQLPRLLFVTAGIAHPWDLYGQMVEYLRMNGIDPQRR